MKAAWFIRIIVTGVLVGIACLGLFEYQAYTFVRGVTDKNLSFLALVTEVKLVLAGLSDTHIPFISGDSREINDTLGKVQNYLLITNLLSLLQLMLLAISKSILLKMLLVLFFVLTLLKQTSNVSMRILILALAINPGLPMYAVVMNHLCAEASIDFEESYHQSLQSTVISLKSEKAGLMQEHEKKLTQISNGGHGIEFFKKFKEDIRYDFKEVKLDIKGEYAHVRALIHNAGQDIVKNIFIFCTMVLFCMLIMPVGYALLIYTLYKRCGLSPVVNSMVNEVQNADAAAEKTIISESGSLSQRVTALFKKPQS